MEETELALCCLNNIKVGWNDVFGFRQYLMQVLSAIITFPYDSEYPSWGILLGQLLNVSITTYRLAKFTLMKSHLEHIFLDLFF